ncbi:hypothetical protein TBR22_A14050 [Luteitalea sp. TBR-22]|uniref:protein phosphatase 2C domain-containing protein n=1 Tax=Luteitalea sp. TBR-22 TaxID=2802971 RepID=UPI001AF89F03|nr:protein phosphatase 2C domain-containing protein [Luteitalea sp. TBR-22]BCS32195.1 hypothetical protein TBR22_A14050 [Luteitalea sp. TBR-22]
MTEATAVRAWQAAARSDAGRVRTNNEDLPLLDAERGLFGVIDGVGGHAAGELAAAIARDVILQRLARPLGTPAERVREAIALANNEIYRRASTSQELAGMTCVVTLALVADGRLTIGHVGDSRLYTMGVEGLRKRTHDHSPVGEREDANEIGEIEAMRHPRRHEVFRDVGSALRDKDEAHYVDVVEAAIGEDEALLACSDGLTDMVPSSTIERLVREHAGDPAAVAGALVAAANEAGGRDNVTVVYAEGPRFAAALRGALVAAPTRGSSEVGRARPGPVRRLLASRTTWFALGALIGVLGALLLAWRAATLTPIGGRTIVAAPQASASVGTLAQAVQAARPGDVIRLEPGTYAEAVTVPEGVSLRARVTGASVFVRPAGAVGDWTAVTATGVQGGTVAGIRITSTTEAPVQVGVRVIGQGRALELLQVEGPVTSGVELDAGASAALSGSTFAVPSGAVRLGPRAELDATGNLVQAAGRAAGPGVVVGEAARVALRRNVFAGFGASPVAGLPDVEREPLRAANVVVSESSSR